MIALLFEELKVENLTQEEVSKYGSKRKGPSYTIIRKKSSREVEEIMALFRGKVVGRKTFAEMIDYARKYLMVIKDASKDKEVIESEIKKIIAAAGLLKTPSLTEQEVDDYEGQNEYASYYGKVEEEILRSVSADERVTKLAEAEENLFKVVEPLKKKIEQKRKIKVELLEKLDE